MCKVRLYQISLRACIKRGLNISCVAGARIEHDRRLWGEGANLPAKLNTVSLAQKMIEDEQGNPSATGACDCFGHRTGDYRFIAVLLEQYAHHFPRIRIVIHAENPFSCFRLGCFHCNPPKPEPDWDDP